MKLTATTLCTFVALATLSPTSIASNLIWSQGYTGQGHRVPSEILGVSPSIHREAADDFELEGVVERIVAAGYLTPGCQSQVLGVHVRFYDVSPQGEPGVVLAEHFLPEGDPRFSHPSCATVLDITLPEPFQATGRHFLSIRLETAGFPGWSWGASTDSDLGSIARFRDNIAGTAWGTYMDGPFPADNDLAFELWGFGPPPPPPVTTLWAQFKDVHEPETPSVAFPMPATDFEAADDFDLEASIERVVLGTAVCYQCAYPDVLGAWVRFYDGGGGVPGALQYERFIGLPSLISSLSLDLTLDVPFQANGKHFISVQLVSNNTHGWGWSRSNVNAPVASSQWVRDRLTGGAWMPHTDSGQPVNADLAFSLYGRNLAAPPQLVSDPCGAWSEVGAPPQPPSDGFSTVQDISVLAVDDAWAVGRNTVYDPNAGNNSFLRSTPVSYHWDGATWTQVPVPSPVPYAEGQKPELYAVEAIAPDDVWAAGTKITQDLGGFLGPQAFVIHWDGTSWTEVAAPVSGPGASGAVVRGISAVSTNEVWFVGDWPDPTTFCEPGLALRWNGSSLELHTTPCIGVGCGTVGGVGLEEVHAIASDDVWAVGGGGDGDSSTCDYVVHWDGTQWSHVPTPEPASFGQRLYGVHASGPSDVWAVGQYLDGLGYHAFAIQYDGVTWTLHEPPGGSLDVHSWAPDDVYAAGANIYHWDGASWSFVEDFGIQSGGNSAVVAGAIDGVDHCELFAGGRQGTVDGVRPFFARQVGSPGTSFCSGDGSSTPCPCGNTGSAGAGCGNSVSFGATLAAFGSPSLVAASLVLRASGCVPGRPGLFFQGTAVVNGGTGAIFGDGLRCVGGAVTRLQLAFADANGSMESSGDLASIGAVSAGANVRYQLWYRDSSGSPCASAFNLSNGLELIWGP